MSDLSEWAKSEEPVASPQEIRDLQRRNDALERALDRYRSGTRIIQETLKEIFSTPVKLEAPPRPAISRKKEKEIAVLHISDTQLGKWTETYSMKVARKRLLRLAEKTVRITELRRNSAAVDEIHVYLGGDLVEGEDIFPHQAHLITAPLLEQAVREGPQIFVEVILYLLRHFPKVRVLCVPGNHGRNSKQAHPATNWDTVCADFIRCALLGTEDHPRKEFAGRLEIEVSTTFYLIDRLPGGWGNLLVHGHQIRGGFAGFPFYGTGRKMGGWADSIDEAWDYLWHGHFHTYGSLVINHRLWLANGTTESDNEFALEQIASRNQPCQRLSFFNSEKGLIADHQVFLEDRVPQLQRFRG